MWDPSAGSSEHGNITYYTVKDSINWPVYDYQLLKDDSISWI